MVYVPILKNRSQEVKFLKEHNNLLSEDIIPMIEIVNDTYTKRYKRDENGEIEYGTKTLKNGRQRRYKKELEPTDDDINTIERLVGFSNGKIMFVDYFRFIDDEYSDIDIKYDSVKLSLILSRSYELYKDRLLELCHYPSVIPVVSIKKGLLIDITELEILIGEIKDKNRHVAVRITSEVFDDDYIDFLNDILDEDDYLLLDIREEELSSQFMELEDFKDMSTDAMKVLLNSPRKRRIGNTSYETIGTTALINNEVAEEYDENDLDGYGDFAGLKDTLPTGGRSNGTGSAIAFFYDYSINEFYVFRNSDTTAGATGYDKVITNILKQRPRLDPLNNCKAIDHILNMKGNGNWSTWHYINILRYIHQVSFNL